MSYTIHYTGTREDKRKKAFADAMEWLSGKQQEAALEFIAKTLFQKDINGKQKIERIQMVMSIAGVHGYPVRAMIRTMWLCKVKSEAMVAGFTKRKK